MNKIISAALLFFLLLPGAQAAPSATAKLQNEILYRVNLGRADDVKLLLTQEASPNFTNEEGVPLLALAATRKDAEAIPIMQVLLDGGADINGVDAQGQTALFHAANAGNKPSVMLLLERGINYYAVDNNGDIARTMAHRAGHEELLAAMDDFVKQQSDKRKQEYETYNQALKERFDAEQKMLEASEEEQMEAIEREFDETAQENAEMQAQYQSQLEAMQQAEAAKRQELINKRSAPEYEDQLKKLVYHTCAFQYWSHCKSLNQTTEIKGEELDIAIDTHHTTATEITEHMIKEYQLKRSYLDGIINRSKKRIFRQLNRMPSKTYRFEHGVGKMEDMNTRCAEIAKYWNTAATVEEDAEEESKQNKRAKKQKLRF